MAVAQTGTKPQHIGSAMSSSVAIVKFDKYLGVYRVLTLILNVSAKSLLNLRVFNRINPRRLTQSS